MRIGWRGVCESGFIFALNGAPGRRVPLSFAPVLAHIKCELQKALAQNALKFLAEALECEMKRGE
jgi:hypothetical protein